MKNKILILTLLSCLTSFASDIVNLVNNEHKEAVNFQEEYSTTLIPLSKYFELNETWPNASVGVSFDYHYCMESKDCTLKLLRLLINSTSMMAISKNKYYKDAPNSDITPLIEMHLGEIPSKKEIAAKIDKLLKYSHFKPKVILESYWRGFSSTESPKLPIKEYYYYLTLLENRVHAGNNIKEVFQDIYTENSYTTLTSFFEKVVLDLHFYNAFLKIKLVQLEKRIVEVSEIEKGNIYAFPIHILPLSNKSSLREIRRTELLATSCWYCDWSVKTKWTITYNNQHPGQIRVSEENIQRILGNNKRLTIKLHYDDFFLIDGFVRANFDKDSGVLHLYENETSERSSSGAYGPSTISGKKEKSIWPSLEMVTNSLEK